MSLIKILSDQSRSDNERLAAVVDIRKYQRLRKDVLPGLRANLKDKCTELAVLVAGAVLRIEADDEAALTVLINALQSNDEWTRAETAAELGTYRKNESKVVPALTASLKDTDPHVRAAAAQALRHYGVKAATAVAALTNALRDSDNNVRIQAAQALDQIGVLATSAIPALVEALKVEKDERVVLALEQALKSLRSASGTKG